MHDNLTQTMLQRREPARAAEADVASAEMTQQPARALIRREPVTCAADRPLREVARLMAEENVNSMIVRAENGGCESSRTAICATGWWPRECRWTRQWARWCRSS